jgi:hypothetical protein
VAENTGDDEVVVEKPVAKITSMTVSHTTQHGELGVILTANVLLKNVQNQQFTLEGLVTDTHGKPFLVNGQPLRASRSVMTGDDEDEDHYSVFIPMTPLYTAKDIPTGVYLQGRLLDPSGKVRSATKLRPLVLNP